jgi:hypothetical protein
MGILTEGFSGLGRRREGLATVSPFSSSRWPVVALSSGHPTHERAKQNHRSPAALTSPKGELRTRLNGAATMGAEAWFDGGEKFAEGHRAVPFYMSKSHISWIIV